MTKKEKVTHVTKNLQEDGYPSVEEENIRRAIEKYNEDFGNEGLRIKVSELPNELYERIQGRGQLTQTEESSTTTNIPSTYDRIYPNIGLPWNDKQVNQSTTLSVTLPIRLINVLTRRVEPIMPSPSSASTVRNYAILSHSWGDREGERSEVQTTRITQATADTTSQSTGHRTWFSLYNSFRGSIGENTTTENTENGTLYPRSYKSLLKATQALNAINRDITNANANKRINYLWMDQLCIDQRDPNTTNNIELDREMLKFRRYYANATLTLVSINTSLADLLRGTNNSRGTNKTQFCKDFRAAALAVGVSSTSHAHADLNTIDATRNFIINQFNHNHVTAEEAVTAYNRGWHYGSEIRWGSVNGNFQRQVTNDGGVVWTHHNWSTITRNAYRGNDPKNDLLRAKMDAYQFNASPTSRWIPRLTDAERERIRNAASETAVNRVRGEIRSSQRDAFTWLRSRNDSTSAINSEDAFNSALDILSIIMRSEWRFSAWAYKEGWLSKQTIFMFDDVLVDGRFLAMVWAHTTPLARQLTPPPFSLPNFTEFRRTYKGKFATPIGWSYGEISKGENLITIRLNVALAALIGRRKTQTLDSLRAILAVLPYGHLVEIEKWRSWASNITTNNNAIFQRALLDVMKVGAMNGYGDFLSWFGLGNNSVNRNGWLPVIEDGRIFITNMVPRHRDVYCAPGANILGTAIKFTERITGQSTVHSGSNWTSFRAEFRRIATNRNNNELGRDTPENNYIIDQYLYDINNDTSEKRTNLTAEEAVTAYNNGWIYGLEVHAVDSDTKRTYQVTLTDGHDSAERPAWITYDWRSTTNSRNVAFNAGYTFNNTSLRALDIARINAYQLDANGVRWNPRLRRTSERAQIRNADTTALIATAQVNIRNARNNVPETRVRLKGFREYDIVDINTTNSPYSEDTNVRNYFYRLDQNNVVNREVFSRKRVALQKTPDVHIILEGTARTLGSATDRGEIGNYIRVTTGETLGRNQKNINTLKLLVPNDSLWRSVRINNDGTENTNRIPIALLVEKTDSEGSARYNRIDLVNLVGSNVTVDTTGQVTLGSLDQGTTVAQIEVWPNR